jgi:hypothetical protein
MKTDDFVHQPLSGVVPALRGMRINDEGDTQ